MKKLSALLLQAPSTTALKMVVGLDIWQFCIEFVPIDVLKLKGSSVPSVLIMSCVVDAILQGSCTLRIPSPPPNEPIVGVPYVLAEYTVVPTTELISFLLHEPDTV